MGGCGRCEEREPSRRAVGLLGGVQAQDHWAVMRTVMLVTPLVACECTTTALTCRWVASDSAVLPEPSAGERLAAVRCRPVSLAIGCSYGIRLMQRLAKVGEAIMTVAKGLAMDPVSRDDAALGQRLHALRLWRGMTLAEVGDLAGFSAAYISMVERGLRTMNSRSGISALAAALRVSETDLVAGPHLTGDHLQSAPHASIPALRMALQTNSLKEPAVDRARPLDDLAGAVRGTLEPLRRACDYTALGAMLPDVLDELHYHAAEPKDEATERLALESVVEACTCAAFMAKRLNYDDLAHLAAQRAQEASEKLGEPLVEGKARFVSAHTRPPSRSLDRNLAAAERAATLMKPHARNSAGLQVLGMLNLTAALAAAMLRQGDVARGWLGEASVLAGRVKDNPHANWQSFSATNVGVWRVAAEVELGETGAAIRELANQVAVDKLGGRSSRRADFFVDVARGLSRDPKCRAEAVDWLRRAEKAGPQRVRNSTSARDTVLRLLQTAKGQSAMRELRGMAARMAVPH
jgi:transcriptional regulator with XRE-family HTH domain